MKKRIYFGILFACLIIPACLEAGEKETSAVAAMQAWLKLADDGNYAQVWDEACTYFKGMVSQEQWIQAMNGARKPLGKVKSRTLRSAELKTSLPGAPDGEYVVVVFETSFENKTSAIETVTAAIEKDGTWKAAGYYIR